MKILFGADVSFNYIEGEVTRERAEKVMQNTSKVFRNADFSIINLENMMGDKEKYEPIVKTGPNLISDDSFMNYIDVLKPSALGLANNHLFDYGTGCFHYTRDLLKKKGYLFAGAGDNIDEAYEPIVFEKDGKKVAIICICENEYGIAELNKAGSAGYQLGRTTKAIKSAIENDMMPIVFFHGGNEYNPYPSPYKVELYRHFIDIGAKAVFAMHTHCPQGYEYYNDSPIVYSMGNFYFPENGNAPSWSYGYMTLLDTDTLKLEIIPFNFDFESHNVLEGDEKEKFIKYIEFISKDYNDEAKMREYFDSWTHISGFPAYLNVVTYSKDMLDCNQEKIKEIKNIFSCEAHNELIEACTKIIYDNALESSKKYVDRLRKLMNMEIPEE